MSPPKDPLHEFFATLARVVEVARLLAYCVAPLASRCQLCGRGPVPHDHRCHQETP